MHLAITRSVLCLAWIGDTSAALAFAQVESKREFAISPLVSHTSIGRHSHFVCIASDISPFLHSPLVLVVQFLSYFTTITHTTLHTNLGQTQRSTSAVQLPGQHGKQESQANPRIQPCRDGAVSLPTPGPSPVFNSMQSSQHLPPLKAEVQHVSEEL